MNAVEIKLKKLNNFYALPEYKSARAAAMDLYAAEDVWLQVGDITMVPTGIAIQLPEGYEAQIRPRSGLAAKGFMVVNSPGTIDSDFRGEIKVIMALLEIEGAVNAFKIERGDRIAQMVISPVTLGIVRVVDELDSTERGEGGFGSTGTK